MAREGVAFGEPVPGALSLCLEFDTKMKPHVSRFMVEVKVTLGGPRQRKQGVPQPVRREMEAGQLSSPS